MGNMNNRFHIVKRSFSQQLSIIVTVHEIKTIDIKTITLEGATNVIKAQKKGETWKEQLSNTLFINK